MDPIGSHRADNTAEGRRNKATLAGRKQLSETDFVGSKHSPIESNRKHVTLTRATSARTRPCRARGGYRLTVDS